jgi:hypothetical protein
MQRVALPLTQNARARAKKITIIPALARMSNNLTAAAITTYNTPPRSPHGSWTHDSGSYAEQHLNFAM